MDKYLQSHIYRYMSESRMCYYVNYDDPLYYEKLKHINQFKVVLNQLKKYLHIINKKYIVFKEVGTCFIPHKNFSIVPSKHDTVFYNSMAKVSFCSCEKIIIDNIRKSPTSYEYLYFVNKQTEKICLEAVKRCGYALNMVRKQTFKICLRAVIQNRKAFQFVEEQYKKPCLKKLHIKSEQEFYKLYPKTPLIPVLINQQIKYI